MQPSYPAIPADGTVQITYLPAEQPIPWPTGVGESSNKPRAKRKPRPKKSERSPKK